MTRHIRWQVLLILVGVLLVAALLAYLAANYTTVLRPGPGGTYVEGIVGEPRYLNPLLSGYNEVDRDIGSLLFSGLTRRNGRGDVEPDLASRWDVVTGPSNVVTYTFTLRPGATWHDGTAVTADDVIFTVRLLQDPAFPGPPELGGALWKAVTVGRVDRRTVSFSLIEPFAPFLDYTTVGILPAHRLGSISATDLPTLGFNTSPIGCGPFQLEGMEAADAGSVESVVLRRFDRYYGDRPQLDRIQFRFYSNDQRVVRAYRAGEIDGIGRVPAALMTEARSLPTLDLLSAPTAEYTGVFFNLRRGELGYADDSAVRRALMHAIDRQAIIDGPLGGQAIPAQGPLLPGTWAHTDLETAYAFDPDLATDLLEEAGWRARGIVDDWRRKGGRRLEFSLLASSEPERLAVAEMLIKQWAAVGITVTLRTASPPEVRQSLETRDFDAILVSVAVPGDPDPYPFWHETQVEVGQNYSGIAHRRISEVIEQARVQVGGDREARLRLYEEFQTLFADQMPALLLFTPVYTYGVDERIHNVQIGPLVHASDRFRTVADWWMVPRRVFVSDAEAESP
jgi:peptide/nickel transport system substrate-binding protein